MSNLPWLPDYTPPSAEPELLQQVTGVLSSAVSAATDVGAPMIQEVAGQAAAQQVQQAVQQVQNVEKTAEGTIGAVTSALPPLGAGSSTGSVLAEGLPGLAGQDWMVAIEGQAKAAAEAAYKQALPAIQAKIVQATTNALQAELTKTLGEPQVATLPSGKELTKLDAWERAGRTFLMGLFTTLLGVILQVIGDAASSGTINFFTTDGWKSVAVLGGGTVVTSVFSYFYRYLKEPDGASIDSSAKS